MIAMGSTTIRPLPLQDANGTYGMVPPPSGSSAPRLAAPQYPSSATPKTALQPPTGGSRLAPPTAGTAPTGLSPYSAPLVNMRMSAPTSVNPVPTFTPPVPAAPTAPQPAKPGLTPPGTNAVSGDEVPYHVAAGPSDATSSMLAKLAAEAGRQLDQPTAWDDALAGQVKDSAARGINANYDLSQERLNSELADRGINYSTIAGGRVLDLNSRRANELSDLDTGIARERANALAAGRSAAFGNASSVFGAQQGVDQTTRNNQVGERDYTDTLRNKAQSDALQSTLLGEQQGRTNDQDFQSLLDRVYGYGANGQAGAAGIYGGQAGAYSADQAADQGGLAQLAALAARFLGSH
jgi:hypothetical protein